MLFRQHDPTCKSPLHFTGWDCGDPASASHSSCKNPRSVLLQACFTSATIRGRIIAGLAEVLVPAVATGVAMSTSTNEYPFSARGREGRPSTEPDRGQEGMKDTTRADVGFFPAVFYGSSVLLN